MQNKKKRFSRMNSNRDIDMRKIPSSMFYIKIYPADGSMFCLPTNAYTHAQFSPLFIKEHRIHRIMLL